MNNITNSIKKMTRRTFASRSTVGGARCFGPQDKSIHARFGKAFIVAVFGSMALSGAWAQKAQLPGVTDTEIRIGNTSPYSGPGSAYSTIAKVEAAYFKMVNESGGINGRKINFISYDDALSPPKTVEQTRKLVESDDVLAMFNTIGTAANLAAIGRCRV